MGYIEGLLYITGVAVQGIYFYAITIDNRMNARPIKDFLFE